jgi:DNA-binding transcriptional MerR regulator
MTDPSAQVEIPNRALFKAAEVCDLLQVQPYVLRSWEAEFPNLGISKTAGAPRVYRRIDVEQVMRIKHMLLVDGLTLAGARRKLDEDTSPVSADEPAINELVGRNARERLTAIKRGLQSILDLLAGAADAGNGRPVAARAPKARASSSRTKPSRGKTPVRSKGGRSKTTRRRGH